MSVAAVRQHLHVSEGIDQVEVQSYLGKLCESLVDSMVGDSQPISVTVEADVGMMVPANAVSVGLIVTERLINAIKYAFGSGRTDCQIRVSHEINGTDWKLVVADNGHGRVVETVDKKVAGLGTAIIGAVSQLDAQVSTVSSDQGVSVTVTHTTFTSPPPLAS